MVRFLLSRLAQLLLTAWGLATLLFVLTRALPDRQQLLARFMESSTSGTTISSQQIQEAQQAARQRLGFVEPVFYISPAPKTPHQLLAYRWQWNGGRNQYHRWLVGLARADLGYSYRSNEPVAALVGAALVVTLPLTCLAAFCIIGLSIPLGLWLASRPNSHWAFVGLFALDALPLFVLALLLLLLLANPDFLALLPAYGFGMEDEAGSGPGSGLPSPSFLAMPLASLVLSGLAEPTLQLANALRQEAQLGYFLTAQAKGLSKTYALRRHALRNALLPTLTLFTELLPNLLAGAVVVELIFALPGMGRMLADAAAARDYPLLLGGVLVVLLVRQLTLALADWLYQLADPRLRASHR